MIQYEFKKLGTSEITNDEVANTLLVVQPFFVGVVGVPDEYGMLACDTIKMIIESVSSKTQAEIKAEILSEIATFITNKYI